MNLCSVFRLNILRTGLDCKFLLTWGQEQQITANLKYLPQLDRLYEDWQYSYLRAYESPLRGRIDGEDFIFTPSQTDWKNKTEEAEKKLLEKFRQWVRGNELLDIREKIISVTNQRTSEVKSRIDTKKCINLLIACESPELVKLPWEAWEITSKDSLVQIHISRTPINNDEDKVVSLVRRGKTRILVILAATSELNLLEDERTLRSLHKVAEVKSIKFSAEQNLDNFKQQLIDQLIDDRGWDALIFAGHSNEANGTRGKLELAPGVSLSISAIEQQLIQAKNQGLKVAVFNSCRGFSIAEYLIELGLHQVVAMREKIHDRMAHAFLRQFCQSLVAHKNIQEAILEVYQYFESEKTAYPSAYLIPSLFRHRSSKAELFRIEPIGLKRVWQDWHPSWQEAVAVGTVLLVGSIVPVQDLLLDSRIGIQAVYRDKTNQIKANTSPPVLLVAVDQESINRAREQIQGFRIRPLDREYLANLVSHLAELKFKTIGVDYLLLTQEPREKKLIEAIKSAVSKENTWFVFAVAQEKQWEIFPKIASPNWSLQGDITFFPGDMELPTDATCEQPCPFAYLLALSYQLNQTKSSTPQPNLQSKYPLQQQVSNYIKNLGVKEREIASLKQAYPPFGWRSIIDFSIPPQQAYEAVPAWKFLNLAFPNSEQQQRIKDQVAIVASVGYVDADAEDNFSVPLAVQYWCQFQDRRKPFEKDCPKLFTGGRIHAYMVHHLLSQHRVTLLPDFWMIVLAVFFGKWTALRLLNFKRKQRQQQLFSLAGATSIYGISGLQIYIWASLSVPWFLPTVVFWTSILFTLRRKPYA